MTEPASTTAPYATKGTSLSSTEQAVQPGHAARRLSRLYLGRVMFSTIWVVLLYSLANSDVTGSTRTTLAGVLLTVYPASDAIATAIDLHGISTRSARLPQQLNLAADVASTLWILAAADTERLGIKAFGVWAVASGVLQVIVASRRIRAVGGQWPMLISGAGSIIGGLSFIGQSESGRPDLRVLAQYSAGGAALYLVTAAWLLHRSKASEGSAASPPIVSPQAGDHRGSAQR